MLEHHRQRRLHKSVLFWGALLVCAALFSLFCYAMLFSDLPLRYLEKSVFSLIPLTLLGGLLHFFSWSASSGVFFVRQEVLIF